MADGMVRGIASEEAPQRFSHRGLAPDFVERHSTQRAMTTHSSWRDVPLTLKDIAETLPEAPKTSDLRAIAGRLHRRAGQVRRGLLRLIEMHIAVCAQDGDRYQLKASLASFDIPDETVPESTGGASKPKESGAVEGKAATGQYAKPVDPDTTLLDALAGTPAQQKLDVQAIARARNVHFNNAFDAAQKAAVFDKSKDVDRYLAREIVALREAADMAEVRLKRFRDKRAAQPAESGA